MSSPTTKNLPTNQDCTIKCRSVKHGQEIWSIGTKGSGKDVVCLWTETCQNYAHVKDEFGRTALHASASTGDDKAIWWLIKHEGSNINAKELLSGYTPLHRSIFFGQIHIARDLIILNANIHSLDNEGYSPLDLWLNDIQLNDSNPCKFSIQSDPSEIYVWGSNDNYNLGNGNQSPRNNPEVLEQFRKSLGPRIKQVCLNTYSSLFVTQTGEVYSCGHGEGGRLGQHAEKPILIPTLIKTKEKCVNVAAGTDHTLFLMENGQVLSCGISEYGVLGYELSTQNRQLTPKVISSLSHMKIEGISTSRYHSLFYTKKYLYSCGTQVGQLGNDSIKHGDKIHLPKLVTSLIQTGDDEKIEKIESVVCNEYSTVIFTSKGHLIILYNMELRKINVKQFNVAKISVTGGQANFAIHEKQTKGSKFDLENNRKENPLCIFILTNNGQLLIWRETLSKGQKNSNSKGNFIEGSFTKIFFNLGRSISIADFSVNQNSLLILTTYGEGFKCDSLNTSNPTTFPNIMDKSQNKTQKNPTEWEILKSRKTLKGRNFDFLTLPLEYLKLKRISNIYSGVQVFSDPKGNNFVILQKDQKLYHYDLPLELPSIIVKNMQDFLDCTSIEDNLHDVEFEVGGYIIPSHLYIIASSCSVLYSKINSFDISLPIKVKIENIDPRIFKQIIQFLYTNSCDIITGKFCVDPNPKNIDWIKETLIYARHLELESLCKFLKLYEICQGRIQVKRDCRESKYLFSKMEKKFNHSQQDHSDIHLISQDGFELKAHRCILAARVEYFNSMFAGHWVESFSDKPIHLPFTKEVLQVLMDYIYTDNSPLLKTTSNINFLSQVLVMSDHFLIKRLSSMTELNLAELISYKNVNELFQLASHMNAEQLKNSCMQFICLNLAYILENRILDSIPTEMLKEITQYNSQFRRNIYQPREISRVGPADFIYSNALESSTVDQDLFDKLELNDEIITPKKLNSKPNKGARVKSRLRTLSSDNETDLPPKPSLGPISTSTCNEQIKNESSAYDLQIAERDSIIIEEEKEQFNVPKSKKKPIGVVQVPIETIISPNNAKPLIKKETNILNLKEFPILDDNLSNLKGPSENYPSTSTSAQAKKTLIPINNQKKKTKWLSLESSQSKEKNIIEVKAPSTPISTSTSGRDPRNPWKTVWNNSPPPNDQQDENSNKKIAFKEIIKEEVQKNENLLRAIAKPLHLMQIEDQAIGELTKHYSRNEDVMNGIEILAVERMTTDLYASPVWIQSPSEKSKGLRN